MRIIFVIVYLGIELANFDAIFDCYLNMIGPFYLHILKSTGFLILHYDVHVCQVGGEV